MRNKKGMIAADMSELGVAAVIVIIAVVILGVASNLNKTGRMANSQEEMEKASFEYLVSLYLKQPIELPDYPDQLITMADLTVMAAEIPNKTITDTPRKNYEDLWKEKTDDFFLTYDFQSFKVKVFLNQEERFRTQHGSVADSGPSGLNSDMILPSYSGSLVKLSIRIEKTKAFTPNILQGAG
jgi:hypothetical protein